MTRRITILLSGLLIATALAAPVASASPSLLTKLRYGLTWSWHNNETTLTGVHVPAALPAGLKLTISCQGPGCAAHPTVRASSSASIQNAMRDLSGKHWRTGSRLRLDFSDDGYLPLSITVRFRHQTNPVITSVN